MSSDIFSCMKSFVAITKYGSFFKASQQLHVSPPVLTKQIQRLESYVGKILLERSNRVVGLTEAGVLYLEHVKDILEKVDEATANIHDLDVEPHGTIRLGIPGYLTWFNLVRYFKCF